MWEIYRQAESVVGWIYTLAMRWQVLHGIPDLNWHLCLDGYEIDIGYSWEFELDSWIYEKGNLPPKPFKA